MKQSRVIAGRGLFTGREASITITPTKAGGIVFAVPSQIGEYFVPATIDAVLPATGPLGGRSTNVGGLIATVHTIEHVMAALAGSSVWNAIVRLAAPSTKPNEPIEIPILDGSAKDFVEAIPTQSGEFPVGMLQEVVRVEDPATGAFIEARPSDRLRYRYELSYPSGSGIDDQHAEWDGEPDQFRREIAPARTFCLEREAVAMKAAGLFAHLTPRDMLVIAPDGRPIDNELRFENEPARHKLLDLIGDLALLGGRLIADVRAVRSGHALTHEFCRRLMLEAG